MNLLKTWRLWLGCALSGLCLWLAFRQVPLGAVADAIGRANPLWLLLAVMALCGSVITRAWRWLVLLERRHRLGDAFWAQTIGFLFTNVFPLRLGEPARVLVMAERCQLPVMHVAASAVVERLLDGGTNVGILLLVLPWMHLPPLMKNAGLTFGALVLLGLGGLLLVVRFDRQGERVIRTAWARLPVFPVEQVTRYWRELVRGLAPLTRLPVAGRAIGWSFGTWACSLAAFWGVLCAFQPDGRILEAAFMMVAVSFAVAVPSSPGFIGVFQFVGQQALVIPFGAKYDAAQALAITLTTHLVYYVLTTTLGVIGLWRLGESFVNLGRTLTGRGPARQAPSLPRVVP